MFFYRQLKTLQIHKTLLFLFEYNTIEPNGSDFQII